MTAESGSDFDLILLGGGLANGLLAYRLRQRRPELRLMVLETGPTFGGNHTWSFHETDLTAAERDWVAPFVAHRWPFYHVAFPDLHRRVDLAYCSISSERFHQVLSHAGVPARFGEAAEILSPREVRLASGEVLSARCVVDGRGAAPTRFMRFGWQKFVGREVRTAEPHRLTGPILMDATVEQHDGYRFVYVLPFDADRLLVEDTYYSDNADLDVGALEARLTTYLRDKGWHPAAVLREEAGVLPITLSGDCAGFWAAKNGQVCAGLRAGLFHPTTGFSWPDAVRLADRVAHLPDLDAEPLFTLVRALADERWRKQAFFRALNRMLFLADDPARRWTIMRRFYGLSEPLVARFYAGALSHGDKLRLLLGRPPVPLAGALRALRDTAVSV
jgi:lycopene beta-cyclase